MKLSGLYLLTSALIGIISFIDPPQFEKQVSENPQTFIYFFRIGLGIAVITLIPTLMKSLRNGRLKEYLSIFGVPIGIGIGIAIIDPDIPQRTFEIIILGLLFANLLVSGVLKRYLAKKWGTEINSYHSEES